MPRTALDLTAEEIKLYKPTINRNEAEISARWQYAWQVARTAAEILRRDFGARRVVLFGSLTDKTQFNQWSDIDLIAWGITMSQFYRAVARITGLSTEFKIDLLDPETCPKTLIVHIQAEGMDL